LILGGAQENTLINCDLLERRGHDVTLITGPAIGPEGDLYAEAKKHDYKLITIDPLIRQIHPANDFLSYIKIKKLLKELKPDIVHTHSAKAGIVGRLAAHSIKPRPLIIHGIHGLAFHPYQNDLINKFYIAVEKFTAKRTDHFICVADAMTNQALAAGIGEPEQFTTAYSAIEEDDFLTPPSEEEKLNFRGKYNIAADAVVLVTIARLFMLKGHDYIIESAKTISKKFPNAVWLFVGDGNLTDTYKKQIAGLGLEEKFKFTGLITPKQIPLAIHSSDILVHCSLREGLARTLPQAMLCSKPVVSFDVDGAKEVVNPSTGRLIEPKNIAQLTEACEELIADSNLRDTLGAAGLESVKQKFSPETMVEAIEAVYEKLMENRK
jgi:glycosyltransferase involved in cell wall biosynthesis